MSEFEPLPTDNAPDRPQVTVVQPKKESILTRPLFLGQSLPWLAGSVLAVAFAAWFLLWPSSPTPDAGELAFGQTSGAEASFSVPEPAPVQTGGLSVPAAAPETGNSVPEDVVKLIREGREFETANREAITRLSDTVRAQSSALAALQERMTALASENSQLANRLTVLAARQTPVAGSHSSASKTGGRTALSGMRLEGVQNGMAWVNWQNRTWAVQAGDSLGAVTVHDVNTADRSVTTSAGVLR